MTKIQQYRRRLAALDVGEIEAGMATPRTTLAACRAHESGLCQLKREVLYAYSWFKNITSDIFG